MLPHGNNDDLEDISSIARRAIALVFNIAGILLVTIFCILVLWQ